MNFRTEIALQPERNQMNYSSEVLFLGSCFAENIHEKLDYYKFKTEKNPFGILFNPVALEKLILNAINAREYTENDLFELNGLWHCFDAHSCLSAPDKESVLTSLNEGIALTREKLHRASHIFITLGTSWVYRHIESDSIVANCHKVPQKKFLKELLPVSETYGALDSMITLVKAINPKVKFILTVSPVRHLRNGFSENTWSKSNLISAVHEIVDPRSNIFYFPSYELMMDDLRDYRFYKDDNIHPNDLTIDYIWSKLKTAWVENTTETIMKEVESVQRGLAHKPFNPHSEKHQIFVANLQDKIAQLKEAYNIHFK